jgi:hypothetical protein
MTNPYRDIPDFCFWSRAMSWPAAGHVDPCVVGQLIQPHERISTLGSCFAQHLARHVKKQGLNYYIAEPAPSGLTETEASARNYGVFSARYGNVYTVRQAVQLFDRAFGTFNPTDGIWEKQSGFVDAFRPQIEPMPFETAAHLEHSRHGHLACVRSVFADSDWIVFTLGLTEGWRSHLDGAVYPVAPGVAGGRFDAERYEFVNFTASEIRTDLCNLIERILEVNSKCKFILTVSPVPLIATYERRHVWTSTTFSKSALRVVCDEVERIYGRRVIYFPSYEVITSPAAGGKYYADDLRKVTELGVKHVMRIFARHFIATPTASETTARSGLDTYVVDAPDIVCDEEAIEQALRYSGIRTAPYEPNT